MKIVQFKDDSYGIRRINLWNLFQPNTSIYQYVNLKVLNSYVDESSSGYLTIKYNMCTVQCDIDIFNCNLWANVNIITPYLSSDCFTFDDELLTKYFIFLTKKRYKNNLTKFDYGH